MLVHAAMLATRRLVGVDRSSVTLMWTACTGFVMLLCVVPFYFATAHVASQLGMSAWRWAWSPPPAQWLALLAYRLRPGDRAGAAVPMRS